MGWNGSGQKGAAPVQPKVVAKKPSPIRGLVAGAVVVALAVAAYFAFFSGGEKPQADVTDKERGLIKEVTPAASAGTEDRGDIIRPSGKSRERKQLTVDRKSAIATPNLTSNTLVIAYGVVNGKSLFKRPIFKYNSENLIAGVLTTQPGTRIIDIPLGRDFEDDFKESLKNPIRAEEGDTEEELKLKQEMVDVKLELSERMEKGEKLSDIIDDARRDLNKLAQYNEDVRHAYYETRDTAKTIEEAEAFRKKANEFLAERGIPPITASKRGHYAVPEELRYDRVQKQKDK